jgi:hypothetical protein
MSFDTTWGTKNGTGYKNQIDFRVEVLGYRIALE